MSKTLGDLIREECSYKRPMPHRQRRLSDLRAEILDDIFNDLCRGHICCTCPYRDKDAELTDDDSFVHCMFVRVMEAVKEDEHAQD